MYTYLMYMYINHNTFEIDLQLAYIKFIFIHATILPLTT